MIRPSARCRSATACIGQWIPEDEQYWDALWGLHNTGQTILESAGVANVDVDGRESLGVVTGTGVVVAVIDDGVDFSQPDLAGQAWVNPGESGGGKETNNVDDDANGYIDDVNGWDFCHDDKTVHDPDDDFHGTHVSGTIAAKLDGAGIVGLAPGVKLMALKFLGDDPACGWDDQAIEAIEYAKSFGVRISNNSWARPASAPPFGDPADDVPLYEAIEDSGMLFVAAAGNSGQDLDSVSRPSIPASFDLPNILSVAAVDNTGQLASFSNYGETSVDVSAPGVSIASLIPDYGVNEAGYYYLDGTSMASPHVAAIAAAGRLTDAVHPHDPDRPQEADPRHRQERGRHGRPDAHGSRGERGRRDRPHRSDGIRAEQLRVRHRRRDRQHDQDACPLAGGHRRPQRRRLVRAAPVGQRRRLDHRHRLDHGPVRRPLAHVLDRVPLPGARARPGRQHRRVCRRPAGPPEADPAERNRGDVQRHMDHAVSSSSASGGSTRYATKSGAWVQFSFTGRAVAVIAPKGASRGSAKVYVDGTYVGTVSAYRSSSQSKIVLFARNWGASGSHKVKLVLTGTAGHPRFDIDAFGYLQ